MGWVWKDDDNDDSSLGFKGINDLQNPNPNSSDSCSTRKIIRSQCNTEEVEPGKFVRKCEKTEEILKSCIGKPAEVVKSTTEYTEEDVTNEMSGGKFFPSSSSEVEPFKFPGLRTDIEAIEKSLLGGLSHFFEAAEEMRNGFFQVFGAPHIYEKEPSLPIRRGIPIEEPTGELPREQKKEESTFSELAGQMRDV